MKVYLTFITIALVMFQIMTGSAQDKYQWLENVEDENALKWVTDLNKKTLDVFNSHPEYQKIFRKNLDILNSTDRIADPGIYGEFVYNFWQDEKHERGIWRRTTLKSYLNQMPQWEILLDLDKLSEKDNIKWVFKGASGLYPEYQKFLVYLSKGGGDAIVIKEFNVKNRSFAEDGFYIPEAKSSASWVDENTLLVSTDFGEGISSSGYPIQVKILKRGMELNKAVNLLKGKQEDMGVWASVFHTENKKYQLISRRTSFYEGEYYFVEKGKPVKLQLPDDIELSGILKDQVIFQLKSDWLVNNKKYPQGAVISITYSDLINGKADIHLLLIPDEKSSVTEISATKDHLLLNMLTNVKNELYTFSWNNTWKQKRMDAPEPGNISLGSTDRFSNQAFFYYQNFLTPSTLFFGDATTGKSIKVQSLPEWFDTTNLQVRQLEATSEDGTVIPYFIVHNKNMKYDGNNPTLLYAYGGFEVPQLPRYSAFTGTAWLEKGGVYVLANIRGGGEFGPKWHQAGLKENRQRVFDDFHAVAESLISKKITFPQKLGIYGGSNGGLLVGVAFTQRPELYGAVVCAVPLLDMQRYNKLLAGASWMAEYGNPDIPEEWEFIKKYSPYHNLKPGMKYPEVFFTTSTRDDRVHPGHARKMAAKMTDLGYKIYYFENTEGGHAGASTNEQRALMNAQVYTFLLMKLMDNHTGQLF